MENYIVNIIIAGFFSITGGFFTILIWLIKKNSKYQKEELINIANAFNKLEQILIFLKIQNIAQNSALQEQFNNGYTIAYNKKLNDLMKQEDFKIPK